ncbi:hypothetical protein OGAPHI_003000 [Ogataea philodendri]|uniref:Uncharacterized protein n=1 Tax=Ogataea philodendri TaxID=1378263 RepID=A0A9P8T621_9ASCO|nr:uncharacterized protein OGAPHI_003000 [Ogataea philodendri]KAH3667351.1 hypothetical protein OGAPHI_003000 [Ogataea philodendri]
MPSPSWISDAIAHDALRHTTSDRHRRSSVLDSTWSGNGDGNSFISSSGLGLLVSSFGRNGSRDQQMDECSVMSDRLLMKLDSSTLPSTSMWLFSTVYGLNSGNEAILLSCESYLTTFSGNNALP